MVAKYSYTKKSTAIHTTCRKLKNGNQYFLKPKNYIQIIFKLNQN